MTVRYDETKVVSTYGTSLLRQCSPDQRTSGAQMWSGHAREQVMLDLVVQSTHDPRPNSAAGRSALVHEGDGPGLDVGILADLVRVGVVRQLQIWPYSEIWNRETRSPQQRQRSAYRHRSGPQCGRSCSASRAPRPGRPRHRRAGLARAGGSRRASRGPFRPHW